MASYHLNSNHLSSLNLARLVGENAGFDAIAVAGANDVVEKIAVAGVNDVA